MPNQEPEKSPFLQLAMGGYTLHPRLRSLTVAQKDESEDPVNQHIAAAEALFREGFQVSWQYDNADLLAYSDTRGIRPKCH